MPDYEENFDDIFQPKLTRADVRNEVERTLRDISTFASQAQASVTNAISELKAAHSDFEEQRPKMLAVLSEIPLLRDAVASAESNPQLGAALPQMYEVVYRASQAKAATAASTVTAEPRSGVLETGGSSDLSDEGTQYQAALASQRVDLSPQNRKALIEELEKRGVGDIEF